MTFEAVSPKGDELLPFEDGVGESVVDGPTRVTALGDGNLESNHIVVCTTNCPTFPSPRDLSATIF